MSITNYTSFIVQLKFSYLNSLEWATALVIRMLVGININKIFENKTITIFGVVMEMVMVGNGL